jgi:hypothetical protein
MSKKQIKTSKQTKKTASTGPTNAKKTRAAAKQTTTPATDGETEAAASRLPPVGTVIKKVDRYGTVRCQCTITEDGVRYKGLNYRSLSGAAMAAAKDLGLRNKTQNVW